MSAPILATPLSPTPIAAPTQTFIYNTYTGQYYDPSYSSIIDPTAVQQMVAAGQATVTVQTQPPPGVAAEAAQAYATMGQPTAPTPAPTVTTPVMGPVSTALAPTTAPAAATTPSAGLVSEIQTWLGIGNNALYAVGGGIILLFLFWPKGKKR
jgi:hypothetical protein